MAHPQLVQIADETVQRYDLCFLCDDDIPYDDTWDRSGAANRTILQQQIKADLLRRHIPFVTLSGSIKSRIETVAKIIDHFNKFRSIGDHFQAMRRGE